jgi:radical SAM/Cys-rich protein
MEELLPNLFDQRVAEAEGHERGLQALAIETIQVNVGLTCNLECKHCHVASSPRRKEQMDWATMEQVLEAARHIRAGTVDITGGAPEMNPHFRRFVEALREENFHVMVRTNLTILLENGYTDLPEFFRDHQVHLVASLPCYLEENVDRQRGEGVHRGSIEALRRLNALGYGFDPILPLDLVYNPIGPSLPPPEGQLEEDYRRVLKEQYGVTFTRLYTITNMPIGQFLGDLRQHGRLEEYHDLLQRSFNPLTVNGLMCRRQISVAWDGSLYDCDFNLALRLRVDRGAPNHISQFDHAMLARRHIMTGEHCLGCTAGHGSSCGGALLRETH